MPRNQNAVRRLWDNVKPAFLANSVGSDLANQFLRRGGDTDKDFGFISMRDQEYYVGMMYAVIRKRANKVAQLATSNLVTLDKNVPEDEQENVEDHPYIQLIDTSPAFANHYFWKALSTFLDLKGVALILAERNYTRPGDEDDVFGRNDTENTLFGYIQSIDIINPYNVTKVRDKDGNVGGYVETRNGQYRTIPPEQIIVVKDINPFDLSDGYSLARAAQDDQFTLRQSGSYTRKSIKNNVGQRGMLTTEAVLSKEQFENFQAQVDEQAGGANAGKFLFGNGPGAISYTDMQIDLEKLALDKVTDISRENLFAASGVGKTMLAIEQSGVTRDSSKTMRENFMADEVEPQLQSILDALNQDYKNAYPEEYEATPLSLMIDSPSKVDKDAEKADAEIKERKAGTANILIRAGFDPQQVMEVAGLPSIPHIGIPSGLPGDPTGKSGDGPGQTSESISTRQLKERMQHLYREQYDEQLLPLIRGKESTLKNDIVNVERKLFSGAVAKIKEWDQNAATPKQLDEVMDEEQREKHIAELTLVLAIYFRSTVPLLGNLTMRSRQEEFGKSSTFRMNNDVHRTIRNRSLRSAKSHVETVLSDIYRTAREAAAGGAGYAEIVSRLSKEFTNVSNTRALAIARTETNRAMTDAQFEADKQFLKDHGLTDRAYKQWETHTPNPCPYCKEMAARGPVPFGTNFLDDGDSFEAEFELADGSTKTKSMTAGYGDVRAGNLHTNCGCTYRLIIEPEA